MSAVAFFVFGVLSASQPAIGQAATVDVAEADRTPMRCKPAPYYVAEQGERPKIDRLMVTGSRVPVTARDFAERRTRPCFLMRDSAPPNPLRTAD